MTFRCQRSGAAIALRRGLLALVVLCAVLLLPGIAADPVVVVPKGLVWEHCCPGGYRRDKALALALQRANAAGNNTIPQLILVSNAESDARGTDAHIDPDVELSLLVARKHKERMALLFRTPAGTAIDFWDGPEGAFERRVLRGKNPFQITPSIQLVSYAGEGDRVRVACVSSQWESTAEDSDLSVKLRQLFPAGQIEVTVGDSAFFREVASRLILYPIHGWSPKPGRSSDIRTRRWTLTR